MAIVRKIDDNVTNTTVPLLKETLVLKHIQQLLKLFVWEMWNVVMLSDDSDLSYGPQTHSHTRGALPAAILLLIHARLLITDMFSLPSHRLAVVLF